MAENSVKISFPMMSVLFIVFLVLKLTNVITWSWWWVTAPLWMPLGLGIIFFLFAMLIFGLTAVLTAVLK